jgi:hypothetical protein
LTYSKIPLLLFKAWVISKIAKLRRKLKEHIAMITETHRTWKTINTTNIATRGNFID